jgi:hypothetical protein
MSVKHLHGPKSVRLSKNEAVVTCVVRNGEFHIEAFIRHYTRMGFRHIFFLDNGSSDRTISIAKSHPNISICQSPLPVQANQPFLKRYLAQHSSEGGWCLDADIDEFFDYPYSELIKLDEFFKYLNKNNFSTVLTHMLDMFSDQPLSSLKSDQEENLGAVYPYFDMSGVQRTPYASSELGSRFGNRNTITNPNTELYWGGIRKTLYGNEFLLTKHSLFTPGKKLDLFPHVHFVNNTRLADISCVILHYKLTGNALAGALQNREHFWAIQKDYDNLIKYLSDESSPGIKRDTALKFQSVTDIVERGFLSVSDAYREYVNSLTQERMVSLPQ